MASAIEPRTGGVEAPSMRGAQVRAPVAQAARNRLGRAGRAHVRETIRGEKAFGQGVQNYRNRAETPFGGRP